MRYIVLDMEWNQPTSYQSSVYRRVGDKLLFEVIQIGAVRLNDRLEIESTFCQPVCPTHYVSIHPRIRRMTHLTHDALAGAPAFMEAMGLFREFCGEDCALLTWGGDDVSVLKQNMDFFGVEGPLPPFYDIQRAFAEAQKLGKRQIGLKTAMEAFEISETEERSFHNALDDAYYTALVFARLPDPERVREFPETPKAFSHSEPKRRLRATSVAPSVGEALAGEAVRKPVCPVCKKPAALTTDVIYQARGKFIALAKCPAHGCLYVRMQFDDAPDGKKAMALNVSLCSRQNRIYAQAKEVQMRQKLADGQLSPAQFEEVRGDFSSNMPFE